jgi:predicted nucleic acid-binding protein
LPLSAFDTNALAYAVGLGESPSDRSKVALAAALLIDVTAEGSLVIPAQVCLEFHHILVRKGGMTYEGAAGMVEACIESALIVPTDLGIAQAAFELAGRHKLQTYDAVVLAAAARARCAILFSEDMQHGFEWEGVRVINPFA